jgi:hypothetical protein
MNVFWRRRTPPRPIVRITPDEELERRWSDEDRIRNERLGKAVVRLSAFPDFADMLAESGPKEGAS